MKLKTTIAGISLENPLMPASGPLVGSYEKMMAIGEFGVGCMVSKTISVEGAVVPRPCILSEGKSIMNAELWSEYPMTYWVEQILPRLKRDLKTPLILSVGYTREDMEFLIPALDIYADAFEVSTHYVGKDLQSIGETVRTITGLTQKPVFMKISPHIPDPVAFAQVVRENGAKGIVAINSLGPCMKIDAASRRITAGNEQGELWTSGPVIKSLALAIVHRIKKALPDFTVIGVGGIESAEDVVEFLLAGADGVQMLSAAMLRGKDLYARIIKDLPGKLSELGFDSVEEVKRTGLANLPLRYEPRHPVIDVDKCTLCGLCEKVCPYFALQCKEQVEVSEEDCFGCGLCQTKCPSKAISGVL